MALFVGLIATTIGIGLIELIHLITNIAFHGNFSFKETQADFSTWGAWAILVPAAGGLLIGHLSDNRCR